MNKNDYMFQTFVEYPEEFRLYDSPEHTALMELIFFKILFTIPDFTNDIYEDRDNHPNHQNAFSNYLHVRMITHVDETLQDVLEEFRGITLESDGMFLDYITDIKDQTYLTYDDHFDYLNLEIGKLVNSTPRDLVSQILEQVAKHLTGVVYALWRVEVIQNCYDRFGTHQTDVILHMKSSNLIVLIYSLPHPNPF